MYLGVSQSFDIPQMKILCLALYATFLIELFGSLEFTFLSSLYILDISPLSDVELVKIFSQFVSFYFVLLTVSFAFQKPYNFMRSICQFLVLEHKLLVFCSGIFPLCLYLQRSSPVSFLLVSLCLVLCGGP